MSQFVLRSKDAKEPLYFVCRTGIGPMTGPLKEAARYPSMDAARDGLLDDAWHPLCSWKIEEVAT